MISMINEGKSNEVYDDLYKYANEYRFTSRWTKDNVETKLNRTKRMFNLNDTELNKVIDKVNKDFKHKNNVKSNPYDENSYKAESAICESQNYTDSELEKVYEIADRYTMATPVSGSWDTELAHEQQAIANELNISMKDAKELMINHLGFSEDDDFVSDTNDTISMSEKNNDKDYIKIGKAIAKYYEEISFNNNSIIIYTNNRNALYKEITSALESIEYK